jgi:hypothetical protein
MMMRRVAWLPRFPCPILSSPVSLSLSRFLDWHETRDARIARHGGGRATQLLWPSAAARPSVRGAPAASHTPAQPRALTAARAPRPEPSGPWDGIPRKFEGVLLAAGAQVQNFQIKLLRGPGAPWTPSCGGGRGPTRLVHAVCESITS